MFLWINKRLNEEFTVEDEQHLQATGFPAIIPVSPTWCYHCLNPWGTFVTVVQSLSIQLFATELMYCSMPGFPLLHYLPESAQTHVHWIGDAIQSPHPLSSPSPPVFNLSQTQGLNRVKVGSLLSWLGLMTSVLTTGHVHPLRHCLWLEHLFYELCCAGAPGKPCRMHCQGHTLRLVCFFRAPHLSCSATQWDYLVLPGWYLRISMAKIPVRQTHLCFNCVFASRIARERSFCLTLPGSIIGKGKKWYKVKVAGGVSTLKNKQELKPGPALLCLSLTQP